MSANVAGSGRLPALDLIVVLARCLVGAAFVYMGMSKVLHPVEFLKLVRQYDVLHHYLALNLVASALPWLEVFCGLLLFLGVAVRGTALMLAILLVAFTTLVLLRALAVGEASGLPFCAIKFDCGCGSGEVFICRKLAENFVLSAISVGLVFWPKKRLSLHYSVV